MASGVYKRTEEHKRKISEARKGIIPWNKGKKGYYHHTEEIKKKIGLLKIGNENCLGKHWKLSPETRKKMSERAKLLWQDPEYKKHMSEVHKGKFDEKGSNWKGGLSKRKQLNERNDSSYKCWVNEVKKRDNNKCRINNEDCSGYSIVHHILPWRDYPELRYNINNGITLCQYHHPKKRIDEQRLIPFFQEMVGSKELIWTLIQH